MLRAAMTVPVVSAARAPSAGLVYSLMGVIALVWGSTWIVIKHGLETLPPLWGAGLRFVVAGAGYFLTYILAAASTGSSETGGLSIWGRRPSAKFVLMDMPVLPCPTFAPGVQPAASAGRSRWPRRKPKLLGSAEWIATRE